MQYTLTELQKDVINSVNTPHGLIYLPPRSKKTGAVIGIINKFKLSRILWVTESKSLFPFVIEEFNNFGLGHLTKNLDFTTYRSLCNIEGFYDVIIFDEVHNITKRSVKNINTKLTFSNILGFSGTESRDYIKNTIFKYLKMNVLYKKTLEESVESKELSDYGIFLMPVELDKTVVEKITKDGRKYTTSEEKSYQNITKKFEKALEINDKKNIEFLSIQRFILLKSAKNKIKLIEKLYEEELERSLFFVPLKKQADKFQHKYHSGTTEKDYLDFKNKEVNKLVLVDSGAAGHTYVDIKKIFTSQISSDKNGYLLQKITRGILKEGEKVLKIYIIYVKNTVEEKWLNSFLKTFNKNKIY